MGAMTKGPFTNSTNIEAFKYTLQLPAIDFFNDSNITCTIYRLDSTSKNCNLAKLYIQGPNINALFTLYSEQSTATNV